MNIGEVGIEWHPKAQVSVGMDGVRAEGTL